MILLAHFDRPKGKRVPAMSLKPIVEPLSKLLGEPGGLRRRLHRPKAARGGGRPAARRRAAAGKPPLPRGRGGQRPQFADALAANGDLYVNDAFSAAHRAHASTEALAHRLPAYAGEQMRRSWTRWTRRWATRSGRCWASSAAPRSPPSSTCCSNLVTKLDKLAIGGGMANTFLYAQGHDVGASYCEKDLAETAREIIRLAGQNNCKLFLPLDIVVAEKMAPGAPARVRGLGAVGRRRAHPRRRARDGRAPLPRHGQLQDPGLERPAGRVRDAALRQGHGGGGAATPPSSPSEGKLVAVAGGGDTVAALNAAGVADDFTFVSTAGGAFLEWMEGKTLPGVAALSR